MNDPFFEEQYDKLNNESRDMQVKYLDMKQKYDEMNEKLLFLSKVIKNFLLFSKLLMILIRNYLNQESNIDFTEIEEALILVRERRSNNKPSDEFSHLIDSEKIKGKRFNLLILIITLILT